MREVLAKVDYLFGRDEYGQRMLQVCNLWTLCQLEELDDWLGW